MISHPKMIKFDDTMKKMLNDVDNFIEDNFGSLYPLHPARPERNTTANPLSDGLFGVRADFTPGFGSELGRGYILNIEMKTLSEVPDDVKNRIYTAAKAKLEELLPSYFPGRKLEVKQDGNLMKIVGDLSLGTL